MSNALRRILYVFSAGVIFLASCSGPQKTIYFKDAVPLNPAVITQKIDRIKEAIVQPDDILAIHVTTISSLLEPAGTTMAMFTNGGTPFSVTGTLGGGGGAGAQSNGYLVDPQGNIDFPFIGKTKVSGMTLRQIKDLIAGKLKNYVKEPVVEARIINYRITVLGEVAHSGTFVAPNHKISIIDALAAAGDIPITGRKDNVLIVRETEGVREFARLNLNSREVFESPYFYLKQNDIVYVEPARIRKQEGNDFFRFYLPTITTLMSALLAVYGIVQLSNK
jgi:polysaccharide export outer membrane protein